MKRGLIVLMSFLVMQAAAANLCQADISYGPLTGTDYVFSSIVESSMTDALPLYDTPTVSGNTLTFTPTNFTSYAENGGFDSTDGQLDVDIAARSGKVITTIELAETGSYVLTGNGTSDTYASVSAPASLRIIQVNGVGIDPISVSGNIVFTPTDYWDSGPGSGTWQGSLVFDVTGALRAKGKSGYATEVLLSFDNSFITYSETDTSARLDKTEMDIHVPEPATISLLALGALVVAGRRKKARRFFGSHLTKTKSAVVYALQASLGLFGVMPDNDFRRD